MRILIVEDELVAQRHLEDLLAPFGRCDVAVDGEEALSLFAEALKGGNRYDLICLDINLPKIGGHDVLTTLRNMEESNGIAVGFGSNVVVTTADSSGASAMRAYRDGKCEGYLVKPIRENELLKLIRDCRLIVRVEVDLASNHVQLLKDYQATHDCADSSEALRRLLDKCA